jgi:FKBP-type peptidyl-prolyl cis-trans isomerase
MPSKRRADTVQGLRQAERAKEKARNKKARTAARDVDAVRSNPRAVRDELQRLRHLDNRDKLDAKGKEKMATLSAIHREHSMAKHAREKQMRDEQRKASGGTGAPQRQQQHGVHQFQSNPNRRQQQQPRRQQGPIIYRPGGRIPPPPPPPRRAGLPPAGSNSSDHAEYLKGHGGHGAQHQSAGRARSRAIRGDQDRDMIGAALPSKEDLLMMQRQQQQKEAEAERRRQQQAKAQQQPPAQPAPGCNGTTFTIVQPGHQIGASGQPRRGITQGTQATVHAQGILRATGKAFWNTRDPGQRPFSFEAGTGMVIKGWDQGCLGMAVGEQRKISIPGHEAYGAKGFSAWGIPPNAALVFTLECLDAEGTLLPTEPVARAEAQEAELAAAPPPPPPPRHLHATTARSEDPGVPPPPPRRKKSAMRGDEAVDPPPPPPPRRNAENSSSSSSATGSAALVNPTLSSRKAVLNFRPRAAMGAKQKPKLAAQQPGLRAAKVMMVGQGPASVRAPLPPPPSPPPPPPPPRSRTAPAATAGLNLLPPRHVTAAAAAAPPPSSQRGLLSLPPPKNTSASEQLLLDDFLSQMEGLPTEQH